MCAHLCVWFCFDIKLYQYHINSALELTSPTLQSVIFHSTYLEILIYTLLLKSFVEGMVSLRILEAGRQYSWKNSSLISSPFQEFSTVHYIIDWHSQVSAWTIPVLAISQPHKWIHSTQELYYSWMCFIFMLKLESI